MANTSIDELKGQISGKGGIALPTLFRVMLPSMGPVDPKSLNLLCMGVNMPGRQIMTQERKIGVVNQKVAYDQLYDDVTMSFLMLNDYAVKQYFETWQDKCLSQSTYEIGYLDEYAFDVDIQQLKKGFGAPVSNINTPRLPPLLAAQLPNIPNLDLVSGTLSVDYVSGDQVAHSVKLKQAFPTSMSAVNLGNSLNDQYIELSVTFAYRNWTSTSSPASGPTGAGTGALGASLGLSAGLGNFGSLISGLLRR